MFAKTVQGEVYKDVHNELDLEREICIDVSLTPFYNQYSVTYFRLHFVSLAC